MKLVLTTFMSLDGVVQAPGGPEEDRSNGFEQGGWQVPFADDDMIRIVTDYFGRASAFLLGRRTYEIFASYWPRVTDPADAIAAPLNRLPKYVASTTLTRLEWENAHLIKGDVPAGVAALKQEPGGELQIHGSARLAQSLIRHGLIDEYRLWTFPVVLGAGDRLFPAGITPTAYRLVESAITGAGASYHVYRPTGAPTYGSFALPEG